MKCVILGRRAPGGIMGTRKRALAAGVGSTVTDFLRIAGYSCCAAAAVSFIGLGVANAEIKAVPQASIDYEHNSNIFAVPAGDPLLVAQGDLTRADTIGTYQAGVAVNGAWGLQKLTALIEGREIRYSHYTDLNHSEYLGDVNFLWVRGQLFDGNVEVHRDHLMALFMNRESTALEVDTNQDERANINYKVASDYRFEDAAARLYECGDQGEYRASRIALHRREELVVRP